MHVNQILVQCLESTIDHSLPQVELWSIWKISCHEPIWAQNWTNSVWLGIFHIIQNLSRIRRSCNYKSCSKLHLLSQQIFWEFFSPRSYFSWGEFSFWRLNSIGNYLEAAPPVRDCLFRWARLSEGAWHWTPRRRTPLKAGRSDQTVRHRRCLHAVGRRALSCPPPPSPRWANRADSWSQAMPPLLRAAAAASWAMPTTVSHCCRC
jgi:hypothetical protein